MKRRHTGSFPALPSCRSPGSWRGAFNRLACKMVQFRRIGCTAVTDPSPTTPTFKTTAFCLPPMPLDVCARHLIVKVYVTAPGICCQTMATLIDGLDWPWLTPTMDPGTKGSQGPIWVYGWCCAVCTCGGSSDRSPDQLPNQSTSNQWQPAIGFP